MSKPDWFPRTAEETAAAIDDAREHYQGQPTSEIEAALDAEREARDSGELSGLGDSEEHQQAIEDGNATMISLLSDILSGRDE